MTCSAVYGSEFIYSPKSIRASQCEGFTLPSLFSNSTPVIVSQLKYFLANSNTFGVFILYFSLFVLVSFSINIVLDNCPGKEENKLYEKPNIWVIPCNIRKSKYS